MGVIGQLARKRVNRLFARHVSSGKAEFFHGAGIDFIFGRREGIYLYDMAGRRRLIDCHCNGGSSTWVTATPRYLKHYKRPLGS